MLFAGVTRDSAFSRQSLHSGSFLQQRRHCGAGGSTKRVILVVNFGVTVNMLKQFKIFKICTLFVHLGMSSCHLAHISDISDQQCVCLWRPGGEISLSQCLWPSDAGPWAHGRGPSWPSRTFQQEWKLKGCTCVDTVQSLHPKFNWFLRRSVTV